MISASARAVRAAIALLFAAVVDVTGTPQLALSIGSNTRQANYASGTDTDSLVFRYKLVQADVDTNGISVAASALTLNSGTIKLMQRTRNAVLGLGGFSAASPSTSATARGGSTSTWQSTFRPSVPTM